MNHKTISNLLKATVNKWNSDKASQLAAALSFYTLFSIAPVLIVSIAVVGLVLGQQAAQNQIVSQIQGLIGMDAAVMIQTMVENANKPGAGLLATIFGLVTILLGAAGAFGQIKTALNQIWGIPAPPSTGIVKDIIRLLREEIISFTIVLGAPNRKCG